jgi:predicted metal-dependent hydrolase
MSQTVVDIPGLPDGVEVRRSTRRRRSVTAFREDGRTVVVVPHRMSRAEIVPYVEELVGRLAERERRGRRTDAQLESRAALLSRRHLEGRAVPSSVRWVSNQRRRWGSCTPADGTIRLSDRLVPMPEYVVDYVLLHELVHLLVADHGPAFAAWMEAYPRLLEARAFLAGVDHATGHGLGTDPEPDGSDVEGPDRDGPHGGRSDAPGVDVVTRTPADAPEALHSPPARRRRVPPIPGTDPLF